MLHLLNHTRNPARYFHKKFPDREIAEIYAKKNLSHHEKIPSI